MKTLRRMPSNTAKLVRAKVHQLAAAPTAMRNIKKLTASSGFRLRVGDWRVVYTIDEGQLVIEVIKIETRGGVYR